MSKVAARVADAFQQSLYLDANPHLRDHLGELVKTGKASPADLDAIPVLAQRLSFDEEAAIKRTLELLEVSPSPKLAAYLDQEISARNRFVAEANARGASNHRATMIALVVDGLAALAGVGYGLFTGNFDLAIAFGMGGAAGGAISTTFGFSRAGTIDADIEHYGVRS
ncbi:MAG: hypothetical protein U1E65_05575 [Myxococcota bacterium]